MHDIILYIFTMGNKSKIAKKKTEAHYLATEKRTSLIIGFITALAGFLFGIWIIFYFFPPQQKQQQIATPIVTPQPTKPSKYIDYTLQENESLWDVAQRFYNDPLKYTKIVRDNNLVNPDAVAPGTKLRLYDAINQE